MNKQENKVEMGREERKGSEVIFRQQEITINRSDLRTSSPFNVNVVIVGLAYDLLTIKELTIKRNVLIINGHLETSDNDRQQLLNLDNRFKSVEDELYDDLKQLKTLISTNKYYEIYDAISPVMMATNYCLGVVNEIDLVAGV